MNTNNTRLHNAIIVAIYTLAVFLLVAIVAGIKYVGTIGEGITPAETISVSGTGNAYAVPDIATVDFDVTDEAAQISSAQTAVTDQTNTILTWLEGQGVAAADIKTTDYTIEPHYENQSQATACPMVAPVASGDSSGSTIIYCPPTGKQVQTGYDVDDSIEVTIRTTSNAGTILAGLGSQKVSNLSGLNFSVDNPDSVEAQARAAAITDAKSKAETLASQLGVHLGRIVNFSEDNGGVVYPMAMMAASASNGASSAPTPEVPSGQNKITSNVTIVYEID